MQEMLDEGRLVEHAGGPERRGRRGVPVALNGQFGHILGFDMEALRLRLVVVDYAGRTVWQKRQSLSETDTREQLIDNVLGFIESCLEEVRPRFANLMGLGLAANGVVDVKRGVILRYDSIPAARDLPLRDLVASRFNLPCCIEDNIRCLTLAEWNHGAARGFNSFICVAVRSGVGAGIVIDGHLFTGSHGLAGELGYLPTATNSGWEILQNLVSETSLKVDVETENFELTPGRASLAGEILGAQLASIAVMFDPQAIVLAGGLMAPDGQIWPHVGMTFRRLALPEIGERVSLLPAQLGPFAAAVGAAYRCFQKLHPVEMHRH
ncbi:MAG: ROK family protein [Phycisphaeraceae bacterium]|nr:ROK family protein [Phycisphaeraceae bacterium]